MITNRTFNDRTIIRNLHIFLSFVQPIHFRSQTIHNRKERERIHTDFSSNNFSTIIVALSSSPILFHCDRFEGRNKWNKRYVRDVNSIPNVGKNQPSVHEDPAKGKWGRLSRTMRFPPPTRDSINDVCSNEYNVNKRDRDESRFNPSL